MSHELEDNIDRRKHIVANVRRHHSGVNSIDLLRLIMEMGYNLRGAREKVKELKFGGWLTVKADGRIYAKDSDSDTHKGEEGEGGEGSGEEEQG